MKNVIPTLELLIHLNKTCSLVSLTRLASVTLPLTRLKTSSDPLKSPSVSFLTCSSHCLSGSSFIGSVSVDDCLFVIIGIVIVIVVIDLVVIDVIVIVIIVIDVTVIVVRAVILGGVAIIILFLSISLFNLHHCNALHPPPTCIHCQVSV